VRRRFEVDAKGGKHPAANRDFALYLEVKARFETIMHPKVVIDTGLTLHECAALALQKL
jgi:hypothetical protein